LPRGYTQFEDVAIQGNCPEVLGLALIAYTIDIKRRFNRFNPGNDFQILRLLGFVELDSRASVKQQRGANKSKGSRI